LRVAALTPNERKACHHRLSAASPTPVASAENFVGVIAVLICGVLAPTAAKG